MLVVAIGDSITQGFPYASKYSWFNLTAEEMGFTFVNCGICGETTGELSARFCQDVVSLKPKYVVIMGGTNDCLYGLPVEIAANNVHKMISKAKENNIIPIVGVPCPINISSKANSWIVALRLWLLEYSRNEEILVVDFYQALTDDKGHFNPLLHNDGVHPNKKGYQVMANVFKDTLIRGGYYEDFES